LIVILWRGFYVFCSNDGGWNVILHVLKLLYDNNATELTIFCKELYTDYSQSTWSTSEKY